MEPTGERSDEDIDVEISGSNSVAAMEPTGERSDESGFKSLAAHISRPQWSRPASGRMSVPPASGGGGDE